MFALGRAIVGATHAAMAVLLMVGISVFAVPTPDFGPPILAMALWSAALLFYWRAVMESRREYWYALGGAVALLLMTSDGALILFAALLLVTALTERGRAAARAPEPWIVLAGLIGFFCVHVYWLERSGVALLPVLARLRGAGIATANAAAWLRLVLALLLAHAGLAVLVVLASGWPRTRAQPAPAVTRAPVTPDAMTFVCAFALVPALLATIVTVLAGERFPVGGAAPLLVLSGLAAVARRRQQRRTAPSTHPRLRLGRPSAGAGIFHSGGDRGVAVDHRHRTAGGAAGDRHGPLLRRQLRPPHRALARRRQRGRTPRRIDRARRAKPSERLFRRRSGALALGITRRTSARRAQ